VRLLAGWLPVAHLLLHPPTRRLRPRPVAGGFGKALGPKELVREMREEIREMRKDYGAI
jgi:hypothetical protein